MFLGKSAEEEKERERERAEDDKRWGALMDRTESQRPFGKQ